VNLSKWNKSCIKLSRVVAVVVALLLSPVTFLGHGVHANANPDVVVLTYEQALRMVLRDLLPVIDADTLIGRAQDQRSTLTEELEHLEQGGWLHENVISIHDELWRIDNQILSAEFTQSQLQENIDLILLEVFENLPLLEVEGVAAALSHALQIAVHGMIGVQSLSSEIAMLELRRLNLLEILWDVSGGTLEQDMIADIAGDIASVERQIQDLRLQQQHIKLARELSLHRALITLCELTSSINVAKAHVALLESNLHRAKIRYELGMSSVNDIRALERALAQTKLDLDALHINRNMAQENLNHLLGVPRSQLTLVEFDRELRAIPQNIELYVKEAVILTPTIRQLQLVVDEANDTRQAYTGDDEDVLRALNEAYERAVLGRNQAIVSMEALMHNGFNALANLQIQKDILLLELEHLQHTLAATQINLDAGRITQHAVAQIEFSIFSVETNLNVLLNEMWVLSFMIENPSLLVD